MAAGQERQEPEEIAQEAQEDKRIFNISDTPDPELNPVSNNFNIDKYNAYIERLKKNLIAFVDKLAQETGREPTEKIFAEFIVTLDGLQRLVESSSAYPAEQLQSMKHHMERIADGLREDAEMISKIRPYLLEEIQKPKYEGRTLEELSVDDKVWGDIVWSAIRAAEQSSNSLPGAKQGTPQKQYLAVLDKNSLVRANLIDMPFDKINATVWNLLTKNANGQISMQELKVEKSGSNIPVTVFYSIDFDGITTDLNIKKKLTPFDKRVYLAISALFNAGNQIATITQIHYAMGNTANPNDSNTKNIRESIWKMMGAQIYIDNRQQTKFQEYPELQDEYKGALLPAEWGRRRIKGLGSVEVIKIHREPPVVSIAKQKRQYTTIAIENLRIPKFSMTEDNISLCDYLIECVTMKNRPKTILLETIYKHTGINTPVKRTRAVPKLQKILDHFKSCNLIKNYNIDKNSGKLFLFM